MSKTIRRKNVNRDGAYDSRYEHNSKPGKADAIYHSDKPKHWNGKFPDLKDHGNMLSRCEKRHAMHNHDNEDLIASRDVVRRGANKFHRFS